MMLYGELKTVDIVEVSTLNCTWLMVPRLSEVVAVRVTEETWTVAPLEGAVNATLGPETVGSAGCEVM